MTEKNKTLKENLSVIYRLLDQMDLHADRENAILFLTAVKIDISGFDANFFVVGSAENMMQLIYEFLEENPGFINVLAAVVAEYEKEHPIK